MFRIRFGKIDLTSAECPTRTGANGIPHLAIGLAHKTDAPFLVAAHNADGDVATVNGVDVWDLEENDWTEEVQGGDDPALRWEDLAEEAGLISEGPAHVETVEISLDTEGVRALVDEALAEAKEAAAARIDELEKLNASLAETLQESGEKLKALISENETLAARVAELEKPGPVLTEGDAEADRDGTARPDNPTPEGNDAT